MYLDGKQVQQALTMAILQALGFDLMVVVVIVIVLLVVVVVVVVAVAFY
jgi:hypothetical protein